MAANQEYDQNHPQQQAQTGQDLTDNIMDLLDRDLNPMFFTPKDLHPREGSNHGAFSSFPSYLY
ncbi:hypothetical protein A2U01_0087040 [Trifolium medium]|uniref:Uncharacterized protein n=1 Tax=Trifolium medium TaxID=97028 RepID=A0A392TXE5_9FABA|nr:hypothetical protein [Trifolium medium]